MNINLSAPINDLSYGLVSQNILRELKRQGHNVALFPIGGNISSVDESDWNINDIRQTFSECMAAAQMFDFLAPTLRIFHQFSLAESYGRGPRVGWPIFELETFNPIELNHLDSCDFLFVCSEWAKNVICRETKRSDKRVFVIPLGVNRNIFHENFSTPEHNETRFINIGKWEVRKGHDILADAFNAAFEPKDDVALYMVPHNFFIKENEVKDWTRLYKESKLGNKITIVPRQKSQADIAKIIAYCDCGVFPSRAEGFNLPALETLSCGKHLIITRCTAHVEYANHNNSHLITMDEEEAAYDGVFFDGSSRWKAFNQDQFDQLVLAMRTIHDMKQNNMLDKNMSGIETAKEFSWQKSAARAAECLAWNDVGVA